MSAIWPLTSPELTTASTTLERSGGTRVLVDVLMGLLEDIVCHSLRNVASQSAPPAFQQRTLHTFGDLHFGVLAHRATRQCCTSSESRDYMSCAYVVCFSSTCSMSSSECIHTCKYMYCTCTSILYLMLHQLIGVTRRRCAATWSSACVPQTTSLGSLLANSALLRYARSPPRAFSALHTRAPQSPSLLSRTTD